jgi:uncharacterized membrane protein YhaH (DUF805 family)
MDIILRPWRRYADFGGRARRTEYFVFILVRYGLLIAVAAMMFAVTDVRPQPGMTRTTPPMLIVIFTVLGVFYFGSIVPGWAVTVRRLHDQGKSFKWLFLTFVPYIGPVAALLFGFWPGDPHENDYGTDPRQPDAAAADELGAVFS